VGRFGGMEVRRSEGVKVLRMKSDGRKELRL